MRGTINDSIKTKCRELSEATERIDAANLDESVEMGPLVESFREIRDALMALLIEDECDASGQSATVDWGESLLTRGIDASFEKVTSRLGVLSTPEGES